MSSFCTHRGGKPTTFLWHNEHLDSCREKHSIAFTCRNYLMSPINIQLLSPAVIPCKAAEHAKCAKKEFPPHFHLCSTNPWLPLSLHTIPTRKATCIKHSPCTPSLLPAHSQHYSSFLLTHHSALLFLGFVFCNPYPTVAWEVEFLVCLGKNPNYIALSAPSCDFFLIFPCIRKIQVQP